MSVTRRGFFRSAAAFSLLAGAVRRGSSTETRFITTTFDPENTANLESITEERLKRFIGERFTVKQDSNSYGSVTLIGVNSTATPSAALSNSNKLKMVGRVPAMSQPSATSFMAQFQGSGNAFQQGTYTLHNDGLGTIPLFLVPSLAGASPATYTAVFNIVFARSRVSPPISMPHSIRE